MKIIIAGLGEAGNTLVKELARESHDITVIDRDSELVDSITDAYSVNGVVGSGASKETLLRAGVEGADIFIALTHIDEVNLLSCMQAKNCGASKTVSRLQMTDLAADVEQLKKEYNIDYIVRPHIDIVEEIMRNLGLPGFVKLEGLFGNIATLIDMSIMRDSCLKDQSLAFIRSNICSDILISTVIREDKLFIPDGNFVLKEGDFITISASNDNLEKTLATLGISRTRSEKVMLVGCGVIGEYLTKELIAGGRPLTIIENNMNRCRTLMDAFPTAKVVYADDEITEVLEEEGLSKTGTLISLTGSDETNLVISMFAWSKRVPSVITKVDKLSHVRLLHRVNIDITASPTELSVLRLLHFIRNTANQRGMNGFYRVADGKAEVMEFTAGSDFKALDIPFADKNFKLKKGILISGIIRDGSLMIPSGRSCIKKGDRVMITAPVEKGIRTLNDIF